MSTLMTRRVAHLRPGDVVTASIHIWGDAPYTVGPLPLVEGARGLGIGEGWEVVREASGEAPDYLAGVVQQIVSPGLYDGIPDDEYHAGLNTPTPSLSQSLLKLLVPPSTPAHLRWRMAHPEPPKRVFDVGRAAHTQALGVGEEMVACPADLLSSVGTMTTNAAKAWALEQRTAGRVPLTPADFDMVRGMADALLHHERVAELLTDPGKRPEVSAYAQHPETGLWLRGRFDLLGGRLWDYKGLALDTPIPTVDGWTTMGSLAVGDRVFGSDGAPCTVTAKSEVHHRTCYCLRFDDGSSVVCDDEHLWSVQSGRAGSAGSTQVRTAREIAETLRLRGQAQHRVAVAGALDLPDVDLPIDPYVLGAWLGDGSRNSGRITKGDAELFDLIAARGYEVAPIPAYADRTPTRTIYGLSRQLRDASLLLDKRIPTEYLRASFDQRLALLRGLLDTDGSWNHVRSQAVFSTVDEALGQQVLELVLSLGQRATMHAYQAHGYGIDREAYRVVFRPRGINPFLMARKASRVDAPEVAKTKRRIIVAADEVPTVPTQCITVDSPDCTYLCTRSMIPTHNTAACAEPTAWRKSAWSYGYHVQDVAYRWLFERTHGTDPGPMEFIVQEKVPPYLVSTIVLDAEFERLGRAQFEAALALYAECVAADRWPGYPEGVVTVSPPAWASEAVDAGPTPMDPAFEAELARMAGLTP